MKAAIIYGYFPGKYARLKSCSDVGGNCIKNTEKVVSRRGKTIVEPGAGTGNITFQLTDDAGYVYGFNRSKAILSSLLQECERVLKPGGYLLILETANLLNELPFGEIYHPVRKCFLSYLVAEHRFGVVYYENDWDFLDRRNIKWARFWLGKNLTSRLLKKEDNVMEECAGIWWKQFPLKPGPGKP